MTAQADIAFHGSVFGFEPTPSHEYFVDIDEVAAIVTYIVVGDDEEQTLLDLTECLRCFYV